MMSFFFSGYIMRKVCVFLFCLVVILVFGWGVCGSGDLCVGLLSSG